MRNFKADRGFLTFAQGKEYVKHAQAQAMSIKLTQDEVTNYAVVVDESAAEELRSTDSSMFDAVIELPRLSEGWDMTQEWRAFSLTPWRETFKTDADMLFTSDIDHWWKALQYRDMCITTKIFDFRGNLVRDRYYRKLFDHNLLPDVYSAMTYFRYSRLASDFYACVKEISNNWEWFAKEHLIKNEDLRPRTDEIYALAARLIGEQHVTWPAEIPCFVHMKEKINNMSSAVSWHKQLPSYWHARKFFVGNCQQYLPFHYHHKEFIDGRTYRSIAREYEELRNSTQGTGRKSAASTQASDEVSV